MLYNVKLNDFELLDIDLMIGCVHDRIDDINRKLQTISCFEDGELKHDTMLSLDRELDIFILWKVQLENAKSDIKELNKVTDN